MKHGTAPQCSLPTASDPNRKWSFLCLFHPLVQPRPDPPRVAVLHQRLVVSGPHRSMSPVVPASTTAPAPSSLAAPASVAAGRGDGLQDLGLQLRAAGRHVAVPVTRHDGREIAAHKVKADLHQKGKQRATR